MSRSTITDSLLEDIADAIREKTGSSAQMTPAEMAQAIRDIDVGYTLDEFCVPLIFKDNNIDLNAESIREFALNAAMAGSSDSPETFAVTADSCTDVGEDAFALSYISSFSSQSCEGIDTLAFDTCENLVSVDIPACQTIGTQAFGGCLSLTSINLPSIRIIGKMAFAYCEALGDVVLGTNVQGIGERAFTGTSVQRLDASGDDLTLWAYALAESSIREAYIGARYIEEGALHGIPEVHLNKKPAIISSMALDGTTTDLYCNWGEGEVSGAPWGATNASIHYNS